MHGETTASTHCFRHLNPTRNQSHEYSRADSSHLLQQHNQTSNNSNNSVWPALLSTPTNETKTAELRTGAGCRGWKQEGRASQNKPKSLAERSFSTKLTRKCLQNFRTFSWKTAPTSLPLACTGAEPASSVEAIRPSTAEPTTLPRAPPHWQRGRDTGTGGRGNGSGASRQESPAFPHPNPRTEDPRRQRPAQPQAADTPSEEKCLRQPPRPPGRAERWHPPTPRRAAQGEAAARQRLTAPPAAEGQAGPPARPSGAQCECYGRGAAAAPPLSRRPPAALSPRPPPSREQDAGPARRSRTAAAFPPRAGRPRPAAPVPLAGGRGACAGASGCPARPLPSLGGKRRPSSSGVGALRSPQRSFPLQHRNRHVAAVGEDNEGRLQPFPPTASAPLSRVPERHVCTSVRFLRGGPSTPSSRLERRRTPPGKESSLVPSLTPPCCRWAAPSRGSSLPPGLATTSFLSARCRERSGLPPPPSLQARQPGEDEWITPQWVKTTAWGWNTAVSTVSYRICKREPENTVLNDASCHTPGQTLV